MPLNHIEISRDNLLLNFNFFKDLVRPSTKIIAVVKANAYGHGLEQVVEILDNHANYFQVDDIEELRKLRKVSKKATFVFGYVQKNDLKELVHLNGILGIYSIEQLTNLDQAAKSLSKEIQVHLCIDSALGRDGILLWDLQILIDRAKELENVEITGLYSHFANIEDTQDFSHAQKQINLYAEAVKLMESNGFNNLQTHISSTAGTMVYESKEGKNQLVRIGIGLYGMYPSNYLKAEFKSKSLELKPVLKWVSRVAQIRTLPANSTIGYGLTYSTSSQMKIAVIPQGYSDGYDRGLSNLGEVLIDGEKCRVLGRISMNMMVVDVTHIKNIQVEDEVVLLGEQNGNVITAESIADKIGTINYEISSRISSLLERIIV